MLFPVLKILLLQIRKRGLILFSNLLVWVTFRFCFLIYLFKNTILMQIYLGYAFLILTSLSGALIVIK